MDTLSYLVIGIALGGALGVLAGWLALRGGAEIAEGEAPAAADLADYALHGGFCYLEALSRAAEGRASKEVAR